jgi:phosphoserine phosphatase
VELDKQIAGLELTDGLGAEGADREVVQEQTRSTVPRHLTDDARIAAASGSNALFCRRVRDRGAVRPAVAAIE